MSTQLAAVGEPDGPRVWDVSNHPRWVGLIAEPLLQARLVWLQDATDVAGRAPLAICLWFPSGRAWIAAAAPPDNLHPEDSAPDKGWIGANEVVVIFTPSLADKLGLLRDDA